MTTTIEEFVAYLGWEVDPGELEEFENQVNDIANTFKKVVVAIGAATGALTALVVQTNKQTAEMANLAASVGLSTEALIALDGVAQDLGKDTETIVDLVEEMNNKFGEMKGLGELKTLEEGTRLLGLRFEDLRRLEPEKQFLTILDAAKQLEDHQQAVSAVDMIFGGEANKILGAIRLIDGSLEDIVERRKQLNFLSEKGVESAQVFNALWVDTKTIVGTAWAEFAGLVGNALTPLLLEFQDFVSENKELIKLRIAEWAEKVGRFLHIVWRVLKQIIFVLNRVVTAFGGLENVLAGLAGIWTGLFLVKIVKLFQTLAPLILTATGRMAAFKAVMTAGKVAGFIGLLVLAGLAVNSLIRFLQGKDSLVGDIGESIAESAHEGMQALADFFGFSKEEFDVWLVTTVDNISDAFASMWETVSGFFKELLNLDWPAIGEFWKDQFLNIFESLKNVALGFLDELININWGQIGEIWKQIFFNTIETIKGWLTGLVDFIADIPNKIVGILSKIRNLPIIGSIIGPAGTASPAATPKARQTPTLQTVRNLAQTQTMQKTINAPRSQVTQSNTLNITAAPGEDTERFARRVVTILEEQAATATRATATGIVK